MQRIYQIAVRGKKKSQTAGAWLINQDCMGFELAPWRSLTAIMVMIVVVVSITVAPCPHVFQVTTAVLRLAAVLTVLALRVVQPALRIADSLLAFSIIIAVYRPCGNRSAQERQNHKRGNECLHLLEHASSSDCLYIVHLDAIGSHARPLAQLIPASHEKLNVYSYVRKLPLLIEQKLRVKRMTEEQVKEYLRNSGCPKAVWEGGTERLVRRWRDFVLEVEKGYCPRCLIDEYWNDLTTRELIHDIGCEDKVKEEDQRFRAMLTATHIKHQFRERQSDYDFWNYGYPKNATGFFYEQIKCHVLHQQ